VVEYKDGKVNLNVQEILKRKK